MMLNSDVCLYKSIALNATGGSSCTFSSCPYASATYAKVNTYAGNNKQWLDDFALAFSKLQGVCGRSTSTPNMPLPCKLSALSTTSVIVKAAEGTQAVAIGSASGEAAGTAGSDDVAAVASEAAAAPEVPATTSADASDAAAGAAAGDAAAAPPADMASKQDIAESYGLGDASGKRRRALRWLV